MLKTVHAIIISAVIAAIPIISVIQNPLQAAQVLEGKMTAEGFLKSNIPLGKELEGSVNGLKYLGGKREIDGLFFSNGGVMQNFMPQDEFAFSNKNLKAVKRVSEAGVPTYFMLIPTACAVKQQEVPKFADLYNQKWFIEQTYRSLAGNATSIDVYPVLFANWDKYIYYRTDTNPTSFGGYLIYQTAATRMNLSPIPLERFTTKYACHDYMGNLTEKWKLDGLEPDILTLYDLDEKYRAYTVTHFTGEGNIVYNTLYPIQFTQLGDSFDAYLGGISPYMQINSSGGGYKGKLLIFGDRTAAAYLPFFASSYASITFVQPQKVSQDALRAIDAQNYDQILFAFSIDEYISSPVCADASKIIIENEKSKT